MFVTAAPNPSQAQGPSWSAPTRPAAQQDVTSSDLDDGYTTDDGFGLDDDAYSDEHVAEQEGLADESEEPDVLGDYRAGSDIVSEDGADADDRLPIDPLDFCALAPSPNARDYQKQRVVLLDVAEDASLAQAPEFEWVTRGKQRVQQARRLLPRELIFPHAREVLLTLLPMKRHYLVVAKVPAVRRLSGVRSMSVDQARRLLASDRFAAYSAGCADWIAMPFVTQGPAEWSRHKATKYVRQGRKLRPVQYMAWDLHVTFSVTVRVFRRAGARFVHAGTLHAASDDFRARFNSSAREMAWNNLQDLHSHLSVDVPMTCTVPGLDATPVGEAQRELLEQARHTTNRVAGALTGGLGSRVATFSGCGGLRLDFSMGQIPAMEQGQGAGPWCKDVNDDVGAGDAALRAVTLCEVRKAVESATGDVQLQAKRLCGWSMFAELVEGANGRGIATGEAEGAERGSYYVAYRGGGCDDGYATAEELGFARMVWVGPGGAAGKRKPSRLKFRAGDPPPGTHMVEYALHGARLALAPEAGLLLSAGSLPSALLFGGAVEIGYDLSRFIGGFDEFWTLSHTALLLGEQGEMLLHFDGSFEGVTYLGRRLGLVTGFGLGGHWVAAAAPRAGVTLYGTKFALSGRAGLEYAMRPDWHLRLIAGVRSSVSSLTLTNDEAPGVSLDAGTLLAVTGGLALAHTF